ncbi:hypothetical protein [Streptomyces sp. NPDC048172]|uniref:hypothetical protein n=1 Tax=Streptomyces sp. NPDC048172 TaxID=3365505 RepID=UPI003712825F
MTVEESWEQIERWLARYAPAGSPLPGPCSRRELEALYEHLGVRLPADVEASLLRHDGSGVTALIPICFELLSVAGIAKEFDAWVEYGRRDREAWWVRGYDKTPNLYVPLAKLTLSMVMVQTRTGGLGGWAVDGGSAPWEEDWPSLEDVLARIARGLDSPPPCRVVLADGEEWMATNEDDTFPETLVWIRPEDR